MLQDSFLFYFRDELLHVLQGVIPLEGALLRKPKPIQRSAGSAELRYCLVLDVAAKASESCRHKQYEFCWNSAEEQVCCNSCQGPLTTQGQYARVHHHVAVQ